MVHNIVTLLADGFEETEALVPVDLLRRVGDKVLLVSIKEGDDRNVVGSHNICVKADEVISKIDIENIDALILPGGPGTPNLDNYPGIDKILETLNAQGKLISAICAAPSILGKRGLLEGRNATCFPGYEESLKGATFLKQHAVTDGNIITAKGAGAALEFGLAIVEYLHGEETAEELAKTIQFIL
ncbi:MAG: DJ-1/PfpI family protein [Bacteroidia bacterium]|nr:DJ-1/PfpI family protein [Bacteroidia bacterium]